MTDDTTTLNEFLAQVDAQLDTQIAGDPHGAEVVLTRIKLLFPTAYAQMQQEGVLRYLENPEALRGYLHGFFEKHRQALM